MFILCIEASVVVKSLVLKVSDKIGGETLIFKTLDLPLLCNLKTKQNLGMSSKAKL